MKMFYLTRMLEQRHSLHQRIGFANLANGYEPFGLGSGFEYVQFVYIGLPTSQFAEQFQCEIHKSDCAEYIDSFEKPFSHTFQIQLTWTCTITKITSKHTSNFKATQHLKANNKLNTLQKVTYPTLVNMKNHQLKKCLLAQDMLHPRKST